MKTEKEIKEIREKMNNNLKFGCSSVEKIRLQYGIHLLNLILESDEE